MTGISCVKIVVVLHQINVLQFLRHMSPLAFKSHFPEDWARIRENN